VVEVGKQTGWLLLGKIASVRGKSGIQPEIEVFEETEIERLVMYVM